MFYIKSRKENNTHQKNMVGILHLFYIMKKNILFVILITFVSTISFGQFIDKNGDGINDIFQDKNGDGVNDVTGVKYPHRFPFIDKNKDGINDVFIDEDGDGVNDIPKSKYKVIDYNNDHINDITKIKYFKRFPRGFRFGFIIEEKNYKIQNYIDKNHDGIYDKINNILYRDLDNDGLNDYFFNKNFDGFDRKRKFLLKHKIFNQKIKKFGKRKR